MSLICLWYLFVQVNSCIVFTHLEFPEISYKTRIKCQIGLNPMQLIPAKLET